MEVEDVKVTAEEDEAVVRLVKPDADEEVGAEHDRKPNVWIDVEGGEVAPVTPRRSPITEGKGLSQ